VLSLPVALWHVREVFIGNVINFTGPVNCSNFISFNTLRSLVLYEVSLLQLRIWTQPPPTGHYFGRTGFEV